MTRLGIDPRTWAQLNALLDAALDLAPAARETWLAGLTVEHQSLLPQLRELLAREARVESGDFLLQSPRLSGDPRDSTAADAAQPRTDDRIGPYRLVRELGRGGMGVVWLAERADGLFQRPVALKLPHPLAMRDDLVERLAREREILARLDHPHIARLYDAGVTAAGQPYLALEYVDGRSIDRYCEAATQEEPLRLFLQVADAVAYAHRHLVLHRDLKPANIQVTAAGDVRLLDFGIAKLLADGSGSETRLTEISGRALTPDYASPEQIAGAPLTVASDVYSLGVVLYELLTRQRPYRLKRDSRGALEDAILSAEPARPSEVAAPELRVGLRGDLDTIILKALKKQPEERYESVTALAEDLERHLEHEPVRAQPDRFGYRLTKFVRRHRAAVAVGAAFVLLAVVGVSAVLWQAHAAIEAQRRAEDINAFIVSIFRDTDPYERSGTPMSVQSLLDSAHTRVMRELAGRPQLQAELLVHIGESLVNLHATDQAGKVLDEAVTIATGALGAEHPTTLRARTNRLSVARFKEDAPALQRELALLLPLLRRQDDKAMLGDALREQAHLFIDRAEYSKAATAARESLEIVSQHYGVNSTLTARASMLLALALEYQHQYADAEKLARASLAQALAAYGGARDNGDVIEARVILARVLGEAGQLKLAVQEMQTAVADARQHFGPGALEVGFFEHSLAKYLSQAGDLATAESVESSVLRIFDALASDEGANLQFTRVSHAGILLAQRDVDAAVAELRPAVEKLVAQLPANHPFVVRGRLLSAQAFAASGKLEAADSQMSLLPADFEDPALAAQALGTRALIARVRGDSRASLGFAQAALEQAAATSDRIARMKLLPELGFALTAAARPTEAQAAFDEALALSQELQITDSPERADARLGLAVLAAQRGDCVKAGQLVDEVRRYWQQWGHGSSLAVTGRIPKDAC